MDNELKTYTIPITWESYKTINVEADNLQSAIYLALKQFLAEPDDNYLDDSVSIDTIVDENYPDENYNIEDVFNNL
jgi:hypothetical protein